jgi:acyl-CoA dehydrogenase
VAQGLAWQFIHIHGMKSDLPFLSPLPKPNALTKQAIISMPSSPTPSLTFLRPEVQEIYAKLQAFVETECLPVEEEFHAHLRHRHGPDRWTMQAVPACLDRLKARAKALGLWNLFIPPHLIHKVPDPSLGPKLALSYREYGILCELLGRCPDLAPEACNCSAPDTGNMEVLLEFGTPQQKERYLLPLLKGDSRSAFLMTEPDVASSDPTNLETVLIKKKMRVNGNVVYELRGKKWWSTGAMDPRCRFALVVAKIVDEDGIAATSINEKTKMHSAHTIVAVPLPHSKITCERALTVFGYDDAPHGHAQVALNGVILDETDLIFGEGSGFAVAQARLGPGRIHHCMRAIGMAARCYELMLERSMRRRTFGKYLYEHGGCQEMIADSCADLEAARLLTLSCAAAMDEVGVKKARDKIAMIKVAVPEMTYRVIDRAVQVFGGAGLSEDFILAKALAGIRSLRIADGPDAVHKRTVARIEINKAKNNLHKTSRL